jgi:hypothetical protein
LFGLSSNFLSVIITTSSTTTTISTITHQSPNHHFV